MKLQIFSVTRLIIADSGSVVLLRLPYLQCSYIVLCIYLPPEVFETFDDNSEVFESESEQPSVQRSIKHDIYHSNATEYRRYVEQEAAQSKRKSSSHPGIQSVYSVFVRNLDSYLNLL